MNSNNKGIALAIFAAVLYAINTPFSKILLDYMPPTLMAGFLYVGAGLGMCVVAFFRIVKKGSNKEQPLSKSELPFTIVMIFLDIAAPICLLIGLNSTTAANASLLNNFEIVTTAIIALMIFKEHISSKLWLGIILITISCAVLSFEDISSFQFSAGSLFILLAAVFWGLENNCTRKLSSKDPMQIVVLKGIFSGCGALIIGFVIGERITVLWSIPVVLLIGLVTYGLSIFFYIYAQRILGAAKTSAYYSIAPFIGTYLSLIIFKESPGLNYFIALAIMIIGARIAA